MKKVKKIGKMKKVQLSLVTTLLLICGVTFAYTPQKDFSASTYIGVQLGYANTHYAKDWLTGGASNVTVGDVNNSGLAGRFHVGYDFNKNFALEVGATFLPKVKFNNVSISGSSGVDLSFNQRIIDLCAKASLPCKYNIDLYGKIGVADVIRDDIEASAGGQTVRSDDQDAEAVPTLGAGIDYGFNDHVFADLAYMHYFGKNDLKATDFVGIGIAYRF